MSHASTVPLPESSPPGATTSTVARIGKRPQRSAAPVTVCLPPLAGATSSVIPSTPVSSERDRDVARFGGRPHGHLRLLTLETSLQARLGVHEDLGQSSLPADRTQHPEQRRDERDELPSCTDQRRRKHDACAGGHRARQRRCMPTQLSFGAPGLDHPRARGTGSRRNSSSTMSAPCTLRTHISGFRLIRCAMVGTASDFTSSGIT